MDEAHPDVASYIELTFPVVLNGQELTLVAMFRPTDAEDDFPTLGSLTLDGALQWVRRLTGIPIETLAHIPLLDLMNLFVALVDALEKHQLAIVDQVPGCDTARPN